MGWPAKQRVTGSIAAFIRGVYLRDMGTDDGVARRSAEIGNRHDGELCFESVAAGRTEVVETAFEIRRRAVHELNEVGEALIEVANADPQQVWAIIASHADFRWTDLFR